jgi:hypothetical protein
VISPGDKFILHADYGTQDKKVAWHKEGGLYPFSVSQGDVLTFDLIDKNSKKIISSGQIAVPEFSLKAYTS